MSALKKILLLLLFCCPFVATAQSHLAGDWMLRMTPPNGGAMEMAVKVDVINTDSLSMMLIDPNGGELPLDEESLVDKKLHFVINTGHGAVNCDLFYNEDDYYAGLCTGAMGEGKTTLKRVVADEGQGGRTPHKP